MFAAAIAIASSRANDWPQFRGPTGQGNSTVKSAPLHWSEESGVAWKAPIPGLGWSSPSISGDDIWLTTAVDEGHTLLAICIDAKSGGEKRRVEVFKLTDPGSIHDKNSHASPTPVIENDRVYLHFGAFGSACISTAGDVVWRAKFEYEHRHGPGGSPVIFENLFIINCDGTDVQFIAALDKNTGQEVWRTERKHIDPRRLSGEASAPMGFSTPLLAKVGGRMQVISTGADHVAGYDARTGEEIWWSTYDGYSLVPRPVVGRGMVYVCSGYNDPMLYAVALGGKGDVTKSHVRWRLEKGAPNNPSPLLVGDEIYVVSDGGIATCLDAKTGKQHWQKRLGGNFSASPIFAAEKIYFLDEDGATTVIAPGKKFRELAKNKVTGRTLASLAPVEGAIFLRTDTHLYRIEE
jgi:outer membrane protein assembly factor BamB